MSNRQKSYTIFKRKGYLWVTLIFFALSIGLHWFFGWKTYVAEQQEAWTVS